MEGGSRQTECGKEEKSLEYKQLLHMARSEQKNLSIAAIFMFISAAATAGYAYLVGPMIRTLFMENTPIIMESATHTFFLNLTIFFSKAPPKWIAGAIVGMSIIKGIAFFVQTLLTAKSGQNILYALRTRLYLGVLDQNPVQNALKSGDLVARFTSDVTEVEAAITKGLISMVRHAIELSALLTLAVALDFRLALIGLLVFPPSAVIINRIGRSLKRRRKAVHVAIGEVGDAVSETVNGLSIIQSFDAKRPMTDRFAKLSGRIRKTTVSALATRALSSPINEILGAIGLALTLVFAADQIATGKLLPETFISFFTALFMLYQPVKGIGTAHHAMQSGLAALDRLEQITPSPALPCTKIPSLNTPLVLNHVSCGYQPDTDILRDLSFSVKPGERIAVVGPSGSGKTTLFNLLLGFLPLHNGDISIGGVPLSKETYRTLFAPVRQEPFLFNDTINNNITMGRPDIAPETIQYAAQEAGVRHFAKDLEAGLNTVVGPGGSRLSVGQRQRVALARALITPRPILLLDEVTASMDGQTEGIIVEALDREKQDKSVIVITHRLSTARWAERLIVIEDGHIAADGPTESLLQEPRVQHLFGNQQ